MAEGHIQFDHSRSEYGVQPKLDRYIQHPGVLPQATEKKPLANSAILHGVASFLPQLERRFVLGPRRYDCFTLRDFRYGDVPASVEG